MHFLTLLAVESIESRCYNPVKPRVSFVPFESDRGRLAPGFSPSCWQFLHLWPSDSNPQGRVSASKCVLFIRIDQIHCMETSSLLYNNITLRSIHIHIYA